MIFLLKITEMQVTNEPTNETASEWEYTQCEETFFVTYPGKWADYSKRIWEASNGNLYQIDKDNFFTDYEDPNAPSDPSVGGIVDSISDEPTRKRNREDCEDCEDREDREEPCGDRNDDDNCAANSTNADAKSDPNETKTKKLRFVVGA